MEGTQQEELTMDENQEADEVYEGNVYNMWISFTNCTITNFELKQQGKPPVKDPPPGGG